MTARPWAPVTSGDGLQLGVRVLLACEKRGGIGSDNFLQFHGSKFDSLDVDRFGGCGAALVESNVSQGSSNGLQNGLDDWKCSGLALMNNPLGNWSFNEPWKQWAAVLHAHFNFFGELYVSVDDILLNYASITYEDMIGALVAMLSFVMRQCIDLMTAKHAWCCWTLTMVACLAASHLGFAWTSSSMTRSERRLKRSRRYRMRTQIKALLFASWACSAQAMEGQQGEQTFLLRMANLAATATSAASAAERALNQLSQAGVAGSSVGG